MYKMGKLAPNGLFPEMDTYTSMKVGERWYRCQDFWKDRPPTLNCESGRFCRAYLDSNSKPTGVFEVGLKYEYTTEGLRDDCECCEEDWLLYLHAMELEFGEPLALVTMKFPYIVDIINKTCSCPDFQQRLIHCKHLCALYYGFCYLSYTMDHLGWIRFEDTEG